MYFGHLYSSRNMCQRQTAILCQTIQIMPIQHQIVQFKTRIDKRNGSRGKDAIEQY